MTKSWIQIDQKKTGYKALENKFGSTEPEKIGQCDWTLLRCQISGNEINQ